MELYIVACYTVVLTHMYQCINVWYIYVGSHVVGGCGQVVITKVGQNAELLKKLCVSFNLRNQKTSTRVHG